MVLALETQRKPPRSVGLLEPDSLALRRNLTFAAPLWEGGGQAFDLMQRQQSNQQAGDWYVGQKGIVWRVDASGEHLRWAAKSGYQLDGDIEFSVFVSFRSDVPTTGNGGIICARSSFSNGLWQMRMNQLNPSNLTFEWRVSSANQNVAWASSVGRGYRTLLVTRKVGGTYELWVDGVSKGTQSNANAPTSSSQDLYLGRLGNANDAALGLYEAAYIWKGRALTNSDAVKLARDPFLPVRPVQHWPALFVQAVAGGATVGRGLIDSTKLSRISLVG
jgi:hypothetical protein